MPLLSIRKLKIWKLNSTEYLLSITSVFINNEAVVINEEMKETGAIVLSDEETEKVSGGTHYAFIYCPHCNKGKYYPDISSMMGIYCGFCNGFFHWQRP